MPQLSCQVREHCRQIAVADEGLRRPAQVLSFQKRQQVHAAVAAANRDERPHRRIAPRAEKSPAPALALRRTGSRHAAQTRSPRRPARSRAAGSRATPLSNSSRGNELAGATIAILSPGRSLWWLQHPDQANCRHLLGDRAMLLRADDGSQLGRRRRAPFAQKALLRQAVALERSLDALDRQPLVLDGVNQRFQRLDLQPDIGRLSAPHISSASQPAAIAATAASPGGYVFAIAFISRSSETITPSKPSSSRSMRWTIFGDNVAGRSSSIDVDEHVRRHDERHAAPRWPP